MAASSLSTVTYVDVKAQCPMWLIEDAWPLTWPKTLGQSQKQQLTSNGEVSKSPGKHICTTKNICQIGIYIRSSYSYNAAIARKLQGYTSTYTSQSTWLLMHCGQYAALTCVLTQLCCAMQAQGYLPLYFYDPF